MYIPVVTYNEKPYLCAYNIHVTVSISVMRTVHSVQGDASVPQILVFQRFYNYFGNGEHYYSFASLDSLIASLHEHLGLGV